MNGGCFDPASSAPHEVLIVSRSTTRRLWRRNREDRGNAYLFQAWFPLVHSSKTIAFKKASAKPAEIRLDPCRDGSKYGHSDGTIGQLTRCSTAASKRRLNMSKISKTADRPVENQGEGDKVSAKRSTKTSKLLFAPERSAPRRKRERGHRRTRARGVEKAKRREASSAIVTRPLRGARKPAEGREVMNHIGPEGSCSSSRSSPLL